MSEYDDFDEVGGFDLEEVADADAVSAPPSPGPQPYEVIDRLFYPDGTPREVPGEGSSPELWEAYFAEQEEEAEEAAQQQVDYPALEGLTPEAAQFMDQAQWEARQAVAQESYQQDLVDRMAKLGREYGIRSPQAIREVAALADAVKADVFTRHLAVGEDVNQAGQAADAAEESAGRAGLQHQCLLAFTRGTSLEQWRMGQEADAARRAREGLPPLPSVYDSPTLQKQAEAAWRYVERVEERKQLEREMLDRYRWRR